MVERYRGVTIIYPEGVAGEIKESVDEIIDCWDPSRVPSGKLSSIIVEKLQNAFSFKVFSGR